MNHLTEKIKVDKALNNSSGSTTILYAWPAYDMQDYDAANFIINAFNLSPGTATGAVNIMQCQAYVATAATSTSLTAITSATASFGSTLTSVLGITGAQALTITFNTASSGTTFSIDGFQITCDGTVDYGNDKILASTGQSNATMSSGLAAFLNSTYSSLTYLVATTDVPVGATVLSSNSVYIMPRDPGSRTLSATGHYGATANKGVLVSGDYVANIGVPAEKMGGKQFITIGVKSSGLKVPFSVNLIRSGARYMPPNNGYAANVNIGSTTT